MKNFVKLGFVSSLLAIMFIFPSITSRLGAQDLFCRREICGRSPSGCTGWCCKLSVQTRDPYSNELMCLYEDNCQVWFVVGCGEPV